MQVEESHGDVVSQLVMSHLFSNSGVHTSPKKRAKTRQWCDRLRGSLLLALLALLSNLLAAVRVRRGAEKDGLPPAEAVTAHPAHE